MKPLIIACTDFSPCSDEALRSAARIAKREGKRVLLVHTFDPKSFAHRQSPGAIETGKTWDSVSMERLRDARRRFFSGLSDTDVQFDAIADAHAAAAIARVANELRAEMVVIGSHGRTGLARALLGSVAEHVVRLAPCTVLVVRESEKTG